MARRLEVEIVGDSRSLQKAYAKAESAGSSFGSTITNIGKVAAVAGAAGLLAFGAGAGKAVTAAVNLGESVNAVNVVFGKASKQLHDFGDKAATQAGLSMRAFNELVTPVGASLQNVGFSADEAAKASINLGKRAADMASVFNVEVADAMEAIQAGLRGEADPLERFGVGLSDAAVKAQALSMGLAKTEKELTANDKAQARLALLMKQTDKVAGDFVNTSESLANQQRILKAQFENIVASVGAELVPALSKGVAAVGDFVTKFQEAKGLEAKVKVALEGAESIATEAKNLGAAAGRLVGDAMASVDWAATGNKIAAGIGEAFRKGIPTLAKFATTITEGFQNAIQSADWVTIGGAIGQGIKDGSKKAVKEGLSDVPARIKASSGPIYVTALQVGLDAAIALTKRFGDKTKEDMPSKMALVPLAIKRGVDPALAVAVAGGGRIGAGLGSGLTAALSGVGASVANTIIWQLQASELAIKQRYGIHSPSTVWADRIGTPLGEGVVLGLVRGTADLPEKMKDSLQRAIERAREVIDRARGTLSTAWQGVSSDALSAFDAIQSGIQTKTEKLLANLQAQREAVFRATAIGEARTALDKAKAGADGVVDPVAVAAAQKALDDALWVQREFGLQQRAAQERRELEARTAMRRRDLENALAALGEKLAREGSKAAAASEAVLKLLGRYGIDFKNVGAAMGVAWIEGLKEAIEAAAKGSGTLAGTIAKAAAGIKVPGRAAGGPVTAGMPYVVGERGREVFVPNQSGRIIPNSAGGSGGGAVLENHVHVFLDGKELFESVRKSAVMNMRAGGAGVPGISKV